MTRSTETEFYVTEAELAVLEMVWDGEMHVRPIAERLYPNSARPKNATVQKLLDRLRDKGVVSRDRTQFPHRYIANVSRSQILTGHLRKLADQLCNGAMAHLARPLVRDTNLTQKERGSLRELLDSLD